MNVVITGAAGFIGSHLVERYLSEGNHVLGVDNFSTGSPRNIEPMLAEERFSFREMDITRRDDLVNSVGEVFHPDLVLHFASPASPVDYHELPLQTLAVNSKGTEACARLAHAFGARMLYASTSECYGDPLEHPQRETYWGNVNPIGPRSCYDESKRFGEALLMAYVRTQDLNARIIRIFNTYGPRMRVNDGRVVPNFISQALRGEPLTIYGDGSQTRSFCYVDDLVDGIVLCAASELTRGRVVNLGNPTEHKVREFAEIVCRVVGVPLQTEAQPMPQDDPGRRCPDISVANELLGWQPKVALEEGLRKTIESMRPRVGK
jgi:dTDP-glucose 4,6-dehydratase